MSYIKVDCPSCGGKHSAAWNEETGLFRCHLCGANGTITTHPKVTKWFQNRGISANTLSEMHVTSGINWMPPAHDLRMPNGASTMTIHFNYILDGVLQYTKLRAIDKCFRLHPKDRTKVNDLKMIPYNIDSIRDTDTCYITESEIDALTLHEIGIANVISAPNGPDFNTNWLDNIIDPYLLNKKRIIICAKMDERGLLFANKLVEDLGNKLNKNIADICAEYGKNKETDRFIKDPNESLVKFGKDFLLDHILNFIP